MAAHEPEGKSSFSLSVDDLETALDSLAAEEGAVGADRRRLIWNLITYIAFGVVLFACPVGLLVVWFDKAFGLRLLLAAGIAFVISAGFVGGTLPRLGRLAEEDELAKVAKAAWQKRARTFYVSVGCLILPGLVAVLAGLVWLIYSLVARHQVSLPALALIAIPLFAFLVFTAIGIYREFQYFSRVSELRGQFAERLQRVSSEGLEKVPISSEEMDLLSQVETQQVVRKVAEVAKELPQRKWYSVALMPEVLGFLKGLPDKERYAIRELADSLQLDPRPPGAQPLAGLENTFVIRSGDYEITYVVDDSRQRIDVTQVRETSQGEVPHAS